MDTYQILIAVFSEGQPFYFYLLYFFCVSWISVSECITIAIRKINVIYMALPGFMQKE